MVVDDQHAHDGPIVAPKDSGAPLNPAGVQGSPDTGRRRLGNSFSTSRERPDVDRAVSVPYNRPRLLHLAHLGLKRPSPVIMAPEERHRTPRPVEKARKR